MKLAKGIQVEFKIRKNDFLRGLRLAQGIADRKNTMPILANVLLRADGKGGLLVAATDLNVSVSANLAVTADKEGGLTVGAKPLHDIVANLPGDELTIKSTESNQADIRAGKVEYKLVGMPDRDFPKMPDHREMKFSKVDGAVLRDMIDKTLFSVSNDETRFHLNGVLFECDGARARMVSTDGHRLSKAESTLTGGPQLASGVIIPRKGLSEIKRLLDAMQADCEMAVHGTNLFLRGGDTVLAVKLIDASYPPYDQVIPKGNDKTAIVECKAFLEALRRASLMSSETRGFRLTLSEGTLQIAGDNPELGEVKEEIAAVYTGAAFSTGFNPRYFVDLITQIDGDRVRMDFAGELDPALLRPEDSTDYIGVIMPMRI